MRSCGSDRRFDGGGAAFIRRHFGFRGNVDRLLFLLVDPLWSGIWRLAAGRAEILPLHETNEQPSITLPYLRPDRSPYRLDTDSLGRSRNADRPFPGPFEVSESGRLELKVWPREEAQ